MCDRLRKDGLRGGGEGEAASSPGRAHEGARGPVRGQGADARVQPRGGALGVPYTTQARRMGRSRRRRGVHRDDALGQEGEGAERGRGETGGGGRTEGKKTAEQAKNAEETKRKEVEDAKKADGEEKVAGTKLSKDPPEANGIVVGGSVHQGATGDATAAVLPVRSSCSREARGQDENIGALKTRFRLCNIYYRRSVRNSAISFRMSVRVPTMQVTLHSMARHGYGDNGGSRGGSCSGAGRCEENYGRKIPPRFV